MRCLVCIVSLLFASIASGQAVWQGRQYNRPVCSSPSCTMCNSIRAQLATPAATETTAAPAGYRYESYRVKMCNGRRCWYETRQRLVPVQSQPVKVQDNPETQATPQRVVPLLVEIGGVRSGDLVYDLGCGDGRILQEAAKVGARVYGVDIDSSQVSKAHERLAKYGNRSLVENRDVGDVSLEQADVVFAYLFPDVLKQIHWDTLKPGARVVSYQHAIPGLDADREAHVVDGQEHVFFVHRVPDLQFLSSTWGLR